MNVLSLISPNIRKKIFQFYKSITKDILQNKVSKDNLEDYTNKKISVFHKILDKALESGPKDQDKILSFLKTKVNLSDKKKKVIEKLIKASIVLAIVIYTEKLVHKLIDMFFRDRLQGLSDKEVKPIKRFISATFFAPFIEESARIYCEIKFNGGKYFTLAINIWEPFIYTKVYWKKHKLKTLLRRAPGVFMHTLLYLISKFILKRIKDKKTAIRVALVINIAIHMFWNGTVSFPFSIEK